MSLFRSLRGKIFITIFLLITATVLLIGLFVLHELKDYLLREKSHDALLSANVVANAARGMFDENIHLVEREQFTRQYGEQVEGRILLIDRQKIVLADRFGELGGQELDLPEIGRVVQGESITRVLLLDDVYVLYVLVPVFGDPDVQGIVMLSLDITPTFEQLLGVQTRIWVASITGGLLLAVVGYFFSGSLTRPLRHMSGAARKLAAGKLEQRVLEEGSQELEDLAQSFNYMASQLEKEDELRKMFISNASHELRSPLASIKALAESMLEDKEPNLELYKEFMSDICKEVDRLSDLGNNLLDFTRYENLKGTLELKFVSIIDIVDVIFQDLRKMAQERNVTLSFNGPDRLFWSVEPDWFRVMLYNVVQNAIKYAPEEKGMVAVYTVEEKENLFVMVEDNGEGVPVMEQQQIFEPFYRVDKARTRKTGGSGLGLSIARKIARAHMGDIFIKSEPGRTVFTISLPRSDK